MYLVIFKKYDIRSVTDGLLIDCFISALKLKCLEHFANH